MAVQSLTYAELSDVWGVSKDAARKKVEGLRLPRKLGNDGKTRVSIDLDEVHHGPKASRAETGGSPGGDRPDHPGGDRPETGRPPSPEVLVLQTMVETLKADLARERNSLDREMIERLQEKERADRLGAELIAMARELAEARSDAARLSSEATRANDAVADRDAWRNLAQRPWWRRLVS